MLAITSPPTTPLATGPQPLALQLGPLDANASLNLLAWSALGQLTTALDVGDGRWQSAHTADLGLGPLAGLKLTNFDSDAYRDLILQGPNSISIFLGDGSGQFAVHQTITPGPPGSLAPLGDILLRLDALLVNGDLLTDVVTVAPCTVRSPRLLGLPQRACCPHPLATPAARHTARSRPGRRFRRRPTAPPGRRPCRRHTHAAGGRWRADVPKPRPESTVTGLGTIADLTAADLDGDGDTDLALRAQTSWTLLLNDNDPLTTGPLANGDFSQGLTGWRTEIVGHASGAMAGSISAGGGFAQLLREGLHGVRLGFRFSME